MIGTLGYFSYKVNNIFLNFKKYNYSTIFLYNHEMAILNFRKIVKYL